MRGRTVKILGIAVVVALALTGSFFLADYVRDNDAARTLIERFGYVGMFLVAIITGLNVFVPIPAATLAPVYVSAGFPLPAVVVILTIGTVIADAIGYLIGVGGRHITKHAHPALQEKMETLAHRHHYLVLPFVFLFAALSPFPNEMILIPLAIIGVRFRALFLPLLLGTLLYETLFAYGATSAFNYFF